MQRHTVGCDPEFFIKNTSTGKFVSAVGKIPGNKYFPQELPSGGGLQVDNVALEFSSPVARDGEDLVEKLRQTLREIKEYLPPDHTIEAAPSAIFDDTELEDEEARRFGCDQDYNAWNMMPNPKPTHANPNFRSCGAHFHIGTVPGDGNEFLEDPFGKIETVKALDATMGVIYSFLDTSPEAVERRKLYGAAGSHRPTDYGVEYRVPSNFWLKSPDLVMLTDNIANDALRLVREHGQVALIEAIGPERIQTIINEGLADEALEIFEKHIKPVLSEATIHSLERVMDNQKTMKAYNMAEEWD